MSSPLPYNPKPPKPTPGFSPREPPDFTDSISSGIVMTTGILVSTFAVRKVKKDMAPEFTMKSVLPLAIVTVLADYIVQYGKRYLYIPYSI